MQFKLTQHNPNRVLAGLALAVSMGYSATSSAALYDNGNGLIYDSSLNVTWTKDANLLGTLEAADSSYVSKIITNIVSITNSQGTHVLSAGDFNGNGLGTASWYGAQAFVAYLDKINYDGSNQWNLPTTSPVNGSSFNYNYSDNSTTDWGYNITSTQSQLAYLNNVELHDPNYVLPNGSFYNPAWTGIAPSEFQDAAHANAADSFSHLQSFAYWSGTEYAPRPGYAWYFDPGYGYQDLSRQDIQINAWAVSPGQVSAIPVPAAAWLFGSALAGFIGLNRRKRP